MSTPTLFTPRKSKHRSGDRIPTMHAITMLRDDHRRISAMFRAFSRDKDDLAAAAKSALVRTICDELMVHTTIEEEIFYPAAREALGPLAEDLMDEADVEHAGAKDLIRELQAMAPGEPYFDAKVTVLGHYIRHHIAAEHDEMFPRCQKSGMDLVAIGVRMASRRVELETIN